MTEQWPSSQIAIGDPSAISRWQSAYADAIVSVEAPAPDTLRIALTPNGAPPHRTWSVLPPVEGATVCEIAVHEASLEVSLRTPALTLIVSREAPRLRVTRADGSVVLGSATLTALDHRLRWISTLASGARVFGGGERTGPLNKRGRTLTFWVTDPQPDYSDATDAMYQSVPLLITLVDGQAHGLFFDSPARATADVGASRASELEYVTTGADLVAYVFAGPTLGDVLRQYTALTGRMPPAPRWALGNQQARWSYLSADELLAVAARFREERIPCDALYLDIDYMRGFRDFTWDAERFSDPAAMIHALKEQNFQLVTILDPGIKVDGDYDVYQEGVQRGYFVRTASGANFEGWVWPGRSVWVDFAQQEVINWWGERQRALVEMGVAGIWIDMNEPTQAGMWAPPEVRIPHGATLPFDTVHGPAHDPIQHTEFHNAYAIEMARATFEGLARLAPERRPFVLTRAASSGSQRYAAVWNGDTTSSWEHLRMGVELNLGVSLSGFPLTGGDIGGFWNDTTPELLVRWTQLGALLPFCRNHSAIGTARQEPWAFGEPYTSACRSAIELRYRLLPYLVTLAHEASSVGAPMIRPLAWIAPEHAASLECDDEFLLGDNLLVAPVLDEAAHERRVVLPPGEWFAWETNQVYNGGQTIALPVGLETLPLFVPSGAILPLAQVTQSSQETQTEPLDLHIYLSRTGQSAIATLWDDDDHPDAERRGSYAAYELKAGWRADGIIEISMARTGGNFTFRYPGVRICLHLPEGFCLSSLSGEAETLINDDTFTRRFQTSPQTEK
jgi:alpha-glucosidase